MGPRRSTYHQALVPELLVQLREALVVGLRVAALAGHVDDDRHLAGVLRQGHLLAVAVPRRLQSHGGSALTGTHEVGAASIPGSEPQS